MTHESDNCNAVEESLILGTMLTPLLEEHASSCARCKATIHMTQRIQSDLESVPLSPANKPLWIRELHARRARAHKRRAWALGGSFALAAIVLLVLGLPRFLGQKGTSGLQAQQRVADPSAETMGASRPVAERTTAPDLAGVRFQLRVENGDGQAVAAPGWSEDLLQSRLEGIYPGARVSIRGEGLRVDVPGDAPADELVESMTRLVESPLGKLSLSLAQDGPMAQLCKQVDEDPRARAAGVSTERAQWLVPNSSESVVRCYLAAANTDEESGRQILERYLSEVDGRFGAELAEHMAFGVNDSNEAAGWRTHYLQAPPPALDGPLIDKASVYWNPDSNGPEVQVEFGEPAASALREITASHLGERLVLRVDGDILLNAVIASEIAGGTVSISMGADPVDGHARAEELADILSTGPLSLRVLSFERVGN